MAVYAQVKVSVAPQLAAAFKAHCKASGVSIASEITRFMSDKSLMPKITLPADYGTRSKRRNAVRRMIQELERIRSAEDEYCSNIPENLRSGKACSDAEQAVEGLTEAIDLLETLF